ncbi:unnamed protein product [Lactuca saligna]|uniref:RecQ-mediated genome instability protein 1 n=1 Tax=Lactuca saligna TaxID=75948 RepID=A0AA35YUN0_LACSI|nr:unnamed protein product [Lactuca saligna]
MSSRRRLRIICSSDEEDDDEEIQEVQPPPQQHDDIECETLNLQDVTLSSINSNPTNPSTSIQVEISDEDFIDAAEDLSPSPQSSPPPPPPPPPPPRPPPSNQAGYSSEYSRTSSAGTSEASGCPISKILEDLGLRLRREWLDACLRGLQTSVPGFSSFDATKKAKLCFEKFLHSDMNICGAGFLPDNVHQMHLVDLPGPFVLQVDEIVNISQPLRERYKKAPSGLKRCLKLSMTDGVQRIFGMEYQPIKDLDALSPAGLKVAISNVNVRHGLLMLVPEVFQVLGGLVEELDAARQRLVNEVNKPPRGKRTRTGVAASLATRATRAAWSTNNVDSSAPSANTVPQSATPIHVNNQGTTTPSVNGRVGSNSSVPVHREHVSVSSNNQNATPMQVDDQGTTTRPSVNGNMSSSSSVHREFVFRASNNHTSQNDATTPIQVDNQGTTTRAPFNGGVSSNSSIPVPLDREYVSGSSNTNVSPIQVDDEEGTTPPSSEHVDFSNEREAQEIERETHSPTYACGINTENPFTYMATLSRKWDESKHNASHVQGKIKCFLTGVKGFQFKESSTYKLQVYIDDGSLISEILIDHNVVQKKIGYSPEEVNAALSSRDSSRVHDMKNKMKQFQVFLVNFEGTMVVRINEACGLPVAIEMQQGCCLSDAWSLLTRLKSNSNTHQNHLRFDPIHLSP